MDYVRGVVGTPQFLFQLLANAIQIRSDRADQSDENLRSLRIGRRIAGLQFIRHKVAPPPWPQSRHPFDCSIDAKANPPSRPLICRLAWQRLLRIRASTVGIGAPRQMAEQACALMEQKKNLCKSTCTLRIAAETIPMTASLARQIVLAARPNGKPQLSDFRLEETEVPAPASGQLLLAVQYLSLDPYICAGVRMTGNHTRSRSSSAMSGPGRTAAADSLAGCACAILASSSGEGPMVRRLAAGGRRIRTCMGFFLSSGCFRFIASSLFGAGKAVLRPVACDQVPGARGRGQGTETLAKLGGLPLSDACVSQRLDA